MTAVSPIRLETVLNVEDGNTSEQVSSFVTNSAGKKMEDIIIDDEILPKRQNTIAEGLHPLLASMKLSGLYFNRQSADASDNPQQKFRRCNAYVIYAAAIVTLLCINVVRMLTVFTQDDKFGPFLFSKLILVIWTIQCAISQTAFYAACFSGRLAAVFSQLLDDSCARHARKFATIYAVVAWSVIMSCTAFFVYGLFFSDGLNDTIIAPLQIHVIISSPTIPRIIASVILFYLMSAYIFSQAMTFVLAMIFSHQFKKVINTLGCCLDNEQRQVSDLDIETFRQQHQEIAMTVSHVDDCLMFSNASAFCCQVSCFIILLYNLTFYQSFITDPVLIISNVLWMFLLSFGLTLTAGGGIMVHHYVSLFNVVAILLGVSSCTKIRS